MPDALRSLYADPWFFRFPVLTSLVSMGAFVAFAAPLTWIAWREPAFARAYRIQTRPPREQRLVGRSIARWLVNNALLFVVTAAAWPLLRHSGVHDGPLPPAWRVAAELLFIVYLDDFLFYWMHRALHRGALYRRIHSVHHRIAAPWAVTAHYMHPLEYVLTGALALLGPVLLGSHLVTLWIWVAFRQWEAAEGHAGYDFPFSPTHFLPGGDGAAHHDFHHAKVRGNYAGFFRHCDALFGTYARDYAAHLASKRGRTGAR